MKNKRGKLTEFPLERRRNMRKVKSFNCLREISDSCGAKTSPEVESVFFSCVNPPRPPPGEGKASVAAAVAAAAAAAAEELSAKRNFFFFQLFFWAQLELMRNVEV